jgi:hypothetical protein
MGQLVVLTAATFLLLWDSIAGIPKALNVNYAQILQARGRSREATELLTKVFAVDTQNTHLRWQLAQAFAADNQLELALEAFGNPTKLDGLALPGQSLFIRLLVEQDRVKDALTYLSSLPTKPLLDVTVAAILANALLSTSTTPGYDDAIFELLRQGLEFHRVHDVRTGFLEFEYLKEAIAQGGSITPAIDDRVRRAIEWKSRLTVPPDNQGGQTSRTSEMEIESLGRVASLLGVSQGSIRFEGDLIRNGDFEAFDVHTASPTGWRYDLHSGTNLYAFNHSGTNRSAFVTGLDKEVKLSGNHSVRIDGLCIEMSEWLEPATAAFRHEQFHIKPNTWYIVQLYYRTEAMPSPLLQLWLARDFGFFLPAADGRWVEATVLGNSGAAGITLEPTISSGSEGSVWFDRLSVYPLLLQTPVLLSSDSAPQLHLVLVDQ